MSGYVSILGPCLTCGRVFSYHPNRVPSVRIKGNREPVCQTCIDLANVKRKAKGLPPLEVKPDAYDACPESEVDWND